MNEGIFVLAIIIVVVIVFVLLITVYTIFERRIRFHPDNLKHWESPFLELSQLRAGDYVPNSNHGYPRVRFEHKGARVVVDVECRANRKIQACYTRVRIYWPVGLMRCEVYPQNFTRTIGTYRDMVDTLIGVTEFDERYYITSADKDTVKSLLRYDVRELVNKLYGFKAGNDIYWRVSGGEFLVKRPGMIRDRDAMCKFVDLCLELYEAALSTQQFGVEIVEDSERSVLELNEAPICQVCGEEIQQNRVACRSCETPHHADCWRYFGACSTYGCGEKFAR